MHRTRSRNCRTAYTHRTLPILLACLSALTLLSSAHIDAAAPTAAAAKAAHARSGRNYFCGNWRWRPA